MTVTTRIDRARQIVEAANPNRIPSYSTSSELPRGITYGPLVMQTRDSGSVERSNYAVIVADMQQRYPDDIATEHDRHFAVGWIDTLYVRYLDDDRNLTEAGAAALKWLERLEQYPVADDEHLSELELDEACNYIAGELTRLASRWSDEHDEQDPPQVEPVDVWRQLDYDELAYADEELYSAYCAAVETLPAAA